MSPTKSLFDVGSRRISIFICVKNKHNLYSVLTRLIDDLLALDSIVHFDLSERRLEQTATFSIPTISDKHELLALDYTSFLVQNLSSVTELMDFIEAHDHLHPISVSEHHGSWGVKNHVVVHETRIVIPQRGGSGDLKDSASTSLQSHWVEILESLSACIFLIVCSLRIDVPYITTGEMPYDAEM
ncbi:hypothetical protein Tco_0765596 [Tanacetum coccineum]